MKLKLGMFSNEKKNIFISKQFAYIRIYNIIPICCISKATNITRNIEFCRGTCEPKLFPKQLATLLPVFKEGGRVSRARIFSN